MTLPAKLDEHNHAEEPMGRLVGILESGCLHPLRVWIPACCWRMGRTLVGVILLVGTMEFAGCELKP